MKKKNGKKMKEFDYGLDYKTIDFTVEEIANFIALEGANKECYWYGLTLTIYALIGDL